MSEDRNVTEAHYDVPDEEVDGIVAVDAPVAVDEPEAEPEPAPPAEPEPDRVELALLGLTAQLAEHQRLLQRQTEVASNLHAENQRLKAGELRQAQSALVVSVLRVFDDIAQMAQTAKVPESRHDLGMVAEALSDALERNGITSTTVEAGTPFDPRAHRIAQVEEAAHAAADRTVARVVRPGFTWTDGSVVRLTDVAVFRHNPVSQ